MQVSKEDLITLLEPVVDGLGFELVDVEFQSGGIGVLRVYIDKAGGIGLEDCAEASQQISALLDVEDPIPGSFTLEVSSPGLDRRLRTIEHFERYVGQRVKVQTKMPVSGRKRFTGELAGIEDGEICLDVDGQKHRVQLADIHSARLVPELDS
ncbi:MAG: ribosome maturation factor RimP [Chromatiales bacterium]|nr:MAG: ribosome maturation factor RimP [Chromatiales bacterium]